VLRGNAKWSPGADALKVIANFANGGQLKGGLAHSGPPDYLPRPSEIFQFSTPSPNPVHPTGGIAVWILHQPHPTHRSRNLKQEPITIQSAE